MLALSVAGPGVVAAGVLGVLARSASWVDAGDLRSRSASVLTLKMSPSCVGGPRTSTAGVEERALCSKQFESPIA